MKRISLWVLVLLLVAFPAHADKTKAVMEDWQRQLKKASESLKAGDFRKAERLSERVLTEMCDAIYGGDRVGAVLATTLTLKTLALVGQGKLDDARWNWWAVLALDPAVAKMDLSAYGALAEALLQIDVNEAIADPLRRDVAFGELQENITPPRVLFREPPKFPAAAAARCLKGQAVIEAIIGKNGRVRNPRLIEAPPVPVQTLAILQSLRGWTFEPAKMDGQAVAVYYVLTVMFETSGCGQGKS
jgi:TonB family protein